MKKLLFVLMLLPFTTFGQIKFSSGDVGIGKFNDWHLSRFTIVDSSHKEVAYLDEDSCLHVTDSSAAINVLIKTCLEQSKEMEDMRKNESNLIFILKEYITPSKYAERED